MAKKTSRAAPPPRAVSTVADAGDGEPVEVEAVEENGAGEGGLAREIARVLDECCLSNAVQNRKLRELAAICSTSRTQFLPAFTRAVTPLFEASRRTMPSERAVRFVSSFAAGSNNEFLGGFLRFLLVATRAAINAARFRGCQIISEIVMKLPDDADVSDDVWNEVIDGMKERVEDKVPAVRAFAVRALSRFAHGQDNIDIIDLFVDALPREQNAEVRKTIVLCMPPTAATLAEVIGRTLDTSEPVRKAAYSAIASKFPLQSLSIKHRTTILQRGLTDRSSSVKQECKRMLREEWFSKSCDGDAIVLLRYLDVETYESVGDEVMMSLLEDEAVKLQRGENIRQGISVASEASDGEALVSKLMAPEVALYWRIICKHLQAEAQAKGSEAASTTGAEAAVYASQSSLSNDLLDDVLPATISEYVELVKAHLHAGPNHRFVARQLVMLGELLDFSDGTNMKVAGSLVQDLLQCPPEHEVDEDGNEIALGDGVSLGGDRAWATAVSKLVKKVHASVGEFEEVMTALITDLACPCRERTANALQWMHCLAVTSLLLENADSFRSLQGKTIEPTELLQSVLLGGAKHTHVDVQRAAMHCLCFFGLLERRPSEELVRQLRRSLIAGPSPVSIMACKALIDLATWHGPYELDKVLSLHQSHGTDENINFIPVDLNTNEDADVGFLDLFYAGLDDEWSLGCECFDQESVQAILGEGFAKILLLSENFTDIPNRLYPLILAKLIILYLNSETKELGRLQQCLSVFFENYPAISAAHKMYLSKAFVLVMRSIWPGIGGHSGGPPALVSKLRKRATKAAQFMLQMIQLPLISLGASEESGDENSDSVSCSRPSIGFECGEEGLAIRIAVEVISCPSKQTPAGKSYMSALCKIAVLLNFRSSEQISIKYMRGLLNHMTKAVPSDREAVKELIRMASRLKDMDGNPTEDLPGEQAKDILEKLELDVDLEHLELSMTVPATPAPPRSTRAAATRKPAKKQESSSSEEEDFPAAVAVPPTPVTNVRAQRASKTAAMNKITAKKPPVISESEEESSVTAEDSATESESED